MRFLFTPYSRTAAKAWKAMKSTKPLAMGDTKASQPFPAGPEKIFWRMPVNMKATAVKTNPPITPTRSASPASTRPAAQGMSQKVSAASRAVSTQQRAGTGFFQSR